MSTSFGYLEKLERIGGNLTSEIDAHREQNHLLETATSCNICNNTQFKLIKSKLRSGTSQFKVYQCLSCEHIQLFPKPTPEEDKAFYDRNQQDISTGKDINIEKLRQNNRFDSNRHVKLLEKLIPHNDNTRILDIGTGYGFFLEECIRKGFEEITGIEISDDRRALAKKITHKPIMDFDFNNPNDEKLGQYDVITLFHVLEHMQAPISFAKNISAYLKPPEGFFICEVPNVEEFLLNTCPAYHDFYWIRAHLNYFNSKVLSFVLKKAGVASQIKPVGNC